MDQDSTQNGEQGNVDDCPQQTEEQMTDRGQNADLGALVYQSMNPLN
jgi:hypothetical protein